MLISRVIEEPKSEGGVFSAEVQAAIRAELELMLSAPSFARSGRCKGFLSYVVLQTLAGHAGELKERTIGTGLFNRANDYDTGEDSIVRVTSNDVRKRIGQFYQESRHTHTVQIDLPRGSYVPEFIIHPAKPSSATTSESEAAEISDVGLSTSETASILEKAAVQGTVPASSETETAPHAISERYRAHKLLVAISLSLLLAAGAATWFGIARSRAKHRPPQLWESFQHARLPILICLGTHDLPTSHIESTQATENFADLVLHKQMIPVDDVTVIASMASLLGKKSIPFRVVSAAQTSLSDLGRQPVILIGAADNIWTQRLTQDLRYRIELGSPGSDTKAAAWIVDAQQPGSSAWRIDFTAPVYSWKNDYAIVARVDDPTTGVPVLIDAGLGNDGSLAASELIASNALADELAKQPSCSGRANFEAVVGTEIIDAKSGPPHILRLQCW